MEVLGEAGLSVPQDISVAGFDDTLLARMTYPPLTTIRQPVREMGHRAVDLLMPKIRKDDSAVIGAALNEGPTPLNADRKDSSLEVFRVELIVRGSVVRPGCGS